jgi:hypothetical protein
MAMLPCHSTTLNDAFYLINQVRGLPHTTPSTTLRERCVRLAWYYTTFRSALYSSGKTILLGLSLARAVRCWCALT